MFRYESFVQDSMISGVDGDVDMSYGVICSGFYDFWSGWRCGYELWGHLLSTDGMI